MAEVETQRAAPEAGRPPHAPSLLHRATSLLSVLGTVWILALMLLINTDVFGRFLFSTPVVGVPEMVSLSIVGIVFLQLAHTLRLNRFIRSDVLIGALLTRRPRAGHGLQAIHHFFGAVLAGIIMYFVYPNFTEAWSEGTYVGNIGRFTVQTWPLLGIILVGAGFTGIQFLVHTYNDIRIALGLALVPSDGLTESRPS